MAAGGIVALSDLQVFLNRSWKNVVTIFTLGLLMLIFQAPSRINTILHILLEEKIGTAVM